MPTQGLHNDDMIKVQRSQGFVRIRGHGGQAMPHTCMADTSRRGSTCCCCCTSGACSRRREESMLCLALCQPWLACSVFSTCLDPSSNTCGPTQAQVQPMTARASSPPCRCHHASPVTTLLHAMGTQEASAEHVPLRETLLGMRQIGTALHT